jgi:hypothetical protein
MTQKKREREEKRKKKRRRNCGDELSFQSFFDIVYI